ncbi:MAG: thiol-disulfide oxidoreductase DCC family protein [Burkholderiaceae bacterium]|nr:thiol-disulfide oxidoreductase DCC family protein [Burkholderiaceae bacterium]
MEPRSNDRVVVYDGHCHLCSGWVQFMERHDLERSFSHIPMHSSQGRELLTQHGIDPDDPTTFLVLDRGRAYTSSAAAIHIVGALGGVWRLALVARIVPRTWRDALYGVFARNRYRWFGRRVTCYLPGQSETTRAEAEAKRR